MGEGFISEAVTIFFKEALKNIGKKTQNKTKQKKKNQNT